MPNVNDLKQSRFLTQKDIDRPVIVTIAGYSEVNVAKEGAEQDPRWTLVFRELEKPMVLNSTNGQIIQAIIGSGEFEDWIGHKIVLYVDPNVSFGGRLVGGIRCRAPKDQAKPAPQPITKPATFDREKSKEALRLAQEADRLAAEIAEPPPEEREPGDESEV